MIISVSDTPAGGTEIVIAISSSADDAEESGAGNVNVSSKDLDLGSRVTGLRFDGVAIHPGATIIDAYIQFQADETTEVSTSLTLTGEATDDSSTFLESSYNITSRPTISATVPWSVPAWTVGETGLNQRTPNLATIVQEIVSRTGWAAGNALSVMISGVGHRAAEPFDSAGLAPELHVVFSGGVPPDNLAPQVDAGMDQNLVLPDTAALDGTVTDDGKPGPLTTTWSQVSGPGVVSFANASAVDTTAAFSAPGTYVLRLGANDGEFVTSDDVTVKVLQAGTQITTIEVSVATSSDDAEESGAGTVDLLRGDLDLGKREIGLRFSNVNVPRGATIVAAQIQFQADESSSEATQLMLHGEAVDHSPTFSSTPFNISLRGLTTASAVWTPPAWNVGHDGLAQRTPDIASIIQEIVSRPGWNRHGAISLVATGNGSRVAEPYDGNGAAPRLQIEYLAAAVALPFDDGGDSEAPGTGSPSIFAAAFAALAVRWSASSQENRQPTADLTIASTNLATHGHLQLTAQERWSVVNDGANTRPLSPCNARIGQLGTSCLASTADHPLRTLQEAAVDELFGQFDELI